MLFKNIGIIDEDFKYQPDKYVGVKDGAISYIGDETPHDGDPAYGQAYDGAGKLLMPALYNAHAHAPMTLLRGYAENAPLQSWLNDLVWPFEAKMTAEDNYWATVLACAEMARCGTVSFSDMYYHTDERVKAVTEAGMKANLSEGALFFEPKPFKDYPLHQLSLDQISSYHGYDEGRIKMDMCIHAEYTSNAITDADVAEFAHEQGLIIHLHASETQSETQECRQRHDGMSPIRFFESLGVFDGPALAAHCVWTDEADWEILADKGVYVAHNPASNMKLASGFAPINQMLAAGVNVCLGTDGMASNNNHDMFQDMYLMALLPKGNLLDPCAITPAQVLRAATYSGAQAQGRTDCGLVKQGFKADLCVLDVSGPSYCPANDMLTNVVYAGHGSDVCLTMCDGRIVYQDGDWPGVDVERAKAEVAARTKRIQAEL